MMPVAKRAAKSVLLGCRIPRLVSRLIGPSVVILRYHSIQHDRQLSATTIGSDITHAASEFERQMALVAECFTPLTMDDVLRFVSGQDAGMRRGVAITFDDGFRDNYEVAAPILKRYGLRAAFYVTVGTVGPGNPPWFCRLRWAFHCTPLRQWTAPDGQAWELSDFARRHEAFVCASKYCAPRIAAQQEEFIRGTEGQLGAPPFPVAERLMMDWGEIRELQEQGHIVGSHTMGHPNVAHAAAGDAYDELEKSRQILERELRAPVVHFSYPSPGLQPHWNDTTVAISQQIGYKTAVTVDSGSVRSRHHPLRLRRVSVPHDTREFRWVLESTFAGNRP